MNTFFSTASFPASQTDGKTQLFKNVFYLRKCAIFQSVQYPHITVPFPLFLFTSRNNTQHEPIYLFIYLGLLFYVDNMFFLNCTEYCIFYHLIYSVFFIFLLLVLLLIIVCLYLCWLGEPCKTIPICLDCWSRHKWQIKNLDPWPLTLEFSPNRSHRQVGSGRRCRFRSK